MHKSPHLSISATLGRKPDVEVALASRLGACVPLMGLHATGEAVEKVSAGPRDDLESCLE